ncbi:hypothetical protein SAMD00019534_089490 [Acytostelium subglobosum LB1]|uniref:hypothetical protein n=1 Tax=Acytostelium subglobosum LB1 TaxID=1410327 RepID=UPI0006451E8D|nr:hypothetical protein SAMD00019534_089490 [Acytostelium subglobosum LB1]GAM25774.1 hypothetical protein SAMD00019534_089490 [Acytostelium subglobosum LB1]|eukprot:XP_012751292.1 hypothetical protein SAMD00019534_089490 [Acytostelium subglobosum LB1]
MIYVHPAVQPAQRELHAPASDGSYRCILPPGLGESCNSTLYCADNYYCHPPSFTCVNAYYLGYGEACTLDIQCSGALTCTNNKCTNTVYPRCESLLDCKYNEVCSANGCAPPVHIGGACQTTYDCSPISTCLFGVCAPAYTVGLGGACTEDNNQCDISKGLSVCI